MAAADGKFNITVFILASTTTLLLQILSNLANDYGDYTKGSDRINRLGPKRMLESGLLTKKQMIKGIILVVFLSLLSGSFLIFAGTKGNDTATKIFFFLLGFGAISAAIKYTIGKRPYGYVGFGDVFVFLFFGLTGVAGTYYLHANTITPDIFLPATSVGLLSAGVLNINNIRDYQNDIKASKRTFVVLIGDRKAKFYHISLLLGAIITGSLYTLINFKSGYQWLFLLTTPLLAGNIFSVFHFTRPVDLNVELRKLAFSTLLFSITFGLGLVI